MVKTLNFINKRFQGKKMIIEDERGVVIMGVYHHLEWYLPDDIYSTPGQTPMLRCYFEPIDDEDFNMYEVIDGFIVDTANPNSIHFYYMDDTGEKIK